MARGEGHPTGETPARGPTGEEAQPPHRRDPSQGPHRQESREGGAKGDPNPPKGGSAPGEGRAGDNKTECKGRMPIGSSQFSALAPIIAHRFEHPPTTERAPIIIVLCRQNVPLLGSWKIDK